jgi:hypothetical protein
MFCSWDWQNSLKLDHILCMCVAKINTPLNSLMDLTASPKVKTLEEGVGVCCLGHNTSKVEGHVGALGWGLGRLANNSITHMNLHKPNHKLVSA